MFLFGNSQVATKKQYLIASFEMKYDKPNEYYYFVIIPQKGADTTDPVYSLIKYDNRKRGVNTEAGYFYNHNDSSSKMYNYFVSPTEGLNFMVSVGWSIIGIYPAVSSDWKTEREVPITTVSSSPVFCFQKEK
jgi:hypothetical protein